MPDHCLTGRDLRSAILFGALVYLALTFLSDIVDVILIFSITALFVVALNPIISWLERHRIPRSIGTVTIAVLFVCLLVLALFLIAPALEAQISDLWKQSPKFFSKINRWENELSQSHPTIARYMVSNKDSIKDASRSLSSIFIGGITKATRSTISLIAGAILIFVSILYSLSNPKPLAEGFLRAAGPEHRERIKAAGERLSLQIRAWAIGNLIAMFSIFLLTWAGLSLVGLKQAFLFGVLAGILEIVPIVGPILSAVLPTIVGLTISPVTALWVILVFIIIQQAENHILVPQIMSRQVSLHPVTIIFAVLVMGGLFGIIGVFLATPAAVTTGILYEELYLCKFENRCVDQTSETSSEER